MSSVTDISTLTISNNNCKGDEGDISLKGDKGDTGMEGAPCNIFRELETLYIETIDDYAFDLYNTNTEQITRDDSGYDLFYCGPSVVVEPFKTATLALGIKGELRGPVHGYELWPRSSIGKTPLQMANGLGLIDYGYRGEIMGKVRNLSQEPYSIVKGVKLFQLCMPDKRPFNVVLVDHLTDTIRGEGGFGSTTIAKCPPLKSAEDHILMPLVPKDYDVFRREHHAGITYGDIYYESGEQTTYQSSVIPAKHYVVDRDGNPIDDSTMEEVD
jgi:dUTP pyrophosphatase